MARRPPTPTRLALRAIHPLPDGERTAGAGGFFSPSGRRWPEGSDEGKAPMAPLAYPACAPYNRTAVPDTDTISIEPACPTTS